jgi:pantetheine-phosphate adenylyltransferase
MDRATQGSPALRPSGGPNSRIAIYPGSFDPFTNGHLDIVERAARLFDEVIVAVGVNLAKKTLFDADDRVGMIREAVSALPNVRAEPLDGLQVEFARANGARFVIRGIRALSDFEFEFEMANMNRQLAPEIEMVFLMTSPEYLFLSASRVKELHYFGADVRRLVPPAVLDRLGRLPVRRRQRTGAMEEKD